MKKMSVSSEVSEEVIKMYLEGTEVVLRIVGKGAKNLAAMIYAMSKDNTKTSGKVRLNNMLKSNKTLKIYTFQAEDLKKFSQEAKRYGVLYCCLAKKKNDKIDGLVDVLIREEDAPKVNRIAERFSFANVDIASVANELDKEELNKNKTIEEKTEDLVKDILGENEKDDEEKIIEQFPSKENTDEKNQSEISYEKENSKKKKRNTKDKKSVREELNEIKNEIEKSKKTNNKENVKFKTKGKRYKEKEEKKNKKYYQL